MSKRTLKNRFTVNDWKTTKTMRKLKRICRWTLISGWGELVRSSQCPFNQTSDVRRSLPAYCQNDRVCDWEEQNMWRLVTTDLSVDFRSVILTCQCSWGGSCFSKRGKCQFTRREHSVTERYEWLRSVIADRTWNIADSFFLVLRSANVLNWSISPCFSGMPIN